MIWIRDFLSTWKRIIRHPGDFFSSVQSTDSLARALAFGLVCHWVGCAVSHMFGSMPAFQEVFWGDSWEPWDQVSRLGALSTTFSGLQQVLVDASSIGVLLGSARVILDPFFSMITLASSAASQWIGVRIFVGRKTWVELLRLASYCYAPFLFCVLPGMAGIVAIYAVVLNIIAIRAYFKVSTGRAIVAYFFPMILLMVAMTALVALAVLVVFKIFG